MKFSKLASFAAAIVIAGVSAACGTTNNYNTPSTNTGILGDSCTSTSDCSSGLHCVNDTCVMGTVTVDGGNGKVDSGGAGGSHAEGGVDSGVTPPPKSEAGAPLGARGDFCQSQSDCATGLSCLPTIEGIGGVCDTVSSGLGANATGKTCSGQCSMATDCCELPIGLATTLLGAGIDTCNDVLNLLSESSITPAECATDATTGATDPVSLGCFVYHAYCECAANTWTCTPNNTCVYTAACSANGATWEGCVSQTRTGAALVTTCTSGKCAAALPVGNCVTAADCEGEAYIPAPGAAAGTCTDATDTDCVCSAGGCYLKCATNIDCKTGYTCDTTTHLCEVVGACVTDAQCAVSTGNVLSTCNTTTGTCTKPCTTDLDCSPPGNVMATDELGTFNGTVCSTTGTTKGTCQPIGCSSNADCDVTGGSGGSTVQLFCVAPVVTPATEVSAITSGGT